MCPVYNDCKATLFPLLLILLGACNVWSLTLAYPADQFEFYHVILCMRGACPVLLGNMYYFAVQIYTLAGTMFGYLYLSC